MSTEQEHEELPDSENNSFSAVAKKEQHKKFVLIAIIILGAIAIYFTLSSFLVEKKKKPIIKKELTSTTSIPVTKSNEYVEYKSKENLPPPLPVIKEPKLPPPPPPPPPSVKAITTIPNNNQVAEVNRGHHLFSNTSDDNVKKNAIYNKMRSQSLIFGGAAEQSKVENESKKENTRNGVFEGFHGGTMNTKALAPSSSQLVVATKVSNDLEKTIIQGKIINAILETAINTDLPSGMIRGLITRDVYGEQGNTILIPKGSRIIGSYGVDSNTKNNNAPRINAIWDRIILPTGIDIKINSKAVDALGAQGVAASLHSKLMNKLTNALLVSLAIPYGIAKISGTDNNITTKVSVLTPTTTNSASTNTSTTDSSNVAIQSVEQGTSGTFIIQDGIKKFQSTAEEAINKSFPSEPTLTVDQGTIMNILVQYDLIFPDYSN